MGKIETEALAGSAALPAFSICLETSDDPAYYLGGLCRECQSFSHFLTYTHYEGGALTSLRSPDNVCESLSPPTTLDPLSYLIVLKVDPKSGCQARCKGGGVAERRGRSREEENRRIWWVPKQ